MIVLIAFAINYYTVVQAVNAVTITTNSYNKQALQSIQPLQQILYPQPLMINNQQPLLLTQQYPEPNTSVFKKHHPEQILLEYSYPQQIAVERKYSLPYFIENSYPNTFLLNQQLQPQPVNFENVISQPSVKFQYHQYPPTQSFIEKLPIVIDNQSLTPLVIEKPAAVQPHVVKNKFAPQQVFNERQPQQQPVFIQQELFPNTNKFIELIYPKQAAIVQEFRPIFLTAQPNAPVRAQAFEIENEKEIESKAGSGTVTLLNIAGIPSAQPMIETAVVEPKMVGQPQSILFYQPRSCFA